jgi:hypothetical protein
MNEQQLAVVKQAIEILKSCNPENEPLYEQVCAYELAVSKSITGLQSIISQDDLDKKAENARELGLSYDDEPKIGCVNHDCDKCKAAQPAVREPVSAKKDAVFAASIEFIGTLTDMKPPPIESAPPEVFKPFRDFTDKVCAIFADQQPEVQQEAVPTVYLYRQPDGSTQVMAPNINDPALVIDILEEGIRAMDEGQPITRN